MCVWTQWSITGWANDEPVILEKYIPQIRIISNREWTEWQTGGSPVNFYKGDPGEPHRDLFLDADIGAFWECKKTGQVAPYTHPVSGSSRAQYWQAGTFWPSFGTNLLAAIHAYIDDLVVRRLETVRTSDGLSISIEGGMITVNHGGTGQRALFGISDKGNLTLQFWRGDTLLIGFGPDEVLDQYSSMGTSSTRKDMDYSAADRSEQHTFTIPSSLGAYYLFAEGWTRVGSAGAYSIQYAIGLSDSERNKPSIFAGKYLRAQANGDAFTVSTLKNNRNNSGNYIVQDGYYAKDFDTSVNDGANYECTQLHIVGGVIVETVYIGYKKADGNGIVLYTSRKSGALSLAQT